MTSTIGETYICLSVDELAYNTVILTALSPKFSSRFNTVPNVKVVKYDDAVLQICNQVLIFNSI